MILSFMLWWLVLQVLSLITWPMTALVFDQLPLKGYAFGKTMGLLLVGYGIWLLAMLGLIRFSPVGIGLVGLLVLSGSLWCWRRAGRVDLVGPWRQGWRSILAYELFFAAALLAGLWLRWHGAVGAAILGTEKPMELAFLSGILHSRTFPPQDPWLAGYAINYYYLGYVFMAVLTSLSGVSVGEAFNLAVATTFALTGLMAAGLTASLVELSGGEAALDKRSVGAVVAAGLSVVFVLILGNQTGALQRLTTAPQVVAFDAGQTISAVQQRLGGATTLRIQPPIQTPAGDFGLIETVPVNQAAPFNWWWPSRAVWDTRPGAAERHYAITEFPFFSFYLGDLHPHVLALPFNFLALALALTVLYQPLPSGWAMDIRQGLRLIVAAIALGSLYMINSWDAPTLMFIFAGALLLGYRRQAASSALRALLKPFLSTLGSVILGAGIAILPFLLTFSSFAGSGDTPAPWSAIPGLRSLARIMLPASEHTSLYQFIVIFGFFGVIGLAYVFDVGLSEPIDTDAVRPRAFFDRYLWIWLPVGLIVGLGVGVPLLALLPLAWLCWRAAWPQPQPPIRAFVLWLIAAGALVLLGADLFYLRDPFESRMNTIFKTYYQAWMIWGTAAAYGVWWLWGRRWRPGLWPALGSLPALALFVGALVYPLAALAWGQPWISGQPTLDGLAYYRATAPAETAALAWIAANTEPNDIILTAVGSSYDGSTGWVAATTGRPTLLGWSGAHERLWRRGSPAVLAEIGRREQDIPTIYKTADIGTAERLLDQYHVRYVFVGPAEQRLYPGPGLDKFAGFLELAFEQGDIRLYRRF